MQKSIVESGNRSSNSTYQVAGFFRRAFAGLLDALIVLSLVLATFVFVQKILGRTVPLLKNIGVDWFIELFIGKNIDGLVFVSVCFLITFSYLFCQLRWQGKTLAQYVLRIRLINEYGENPSTFQLLLRIVVGFISFIFAGLGYFWMLADSQGRTWGDMVAKTYVVKASLVNREK